jgi:hypothetical protein
MSKKPTRKHNRSQKLGQSIPSQPKIQAADKSRKPTTQFWTILSIVLTAIGLIALIQLRPRLSASAIPVSVVGQELFSRFTVSNDGYVKITDVQMSCYIWKAVAQDITNNETGNNVHINDALSHPISPPSQILLPNEGYTLPCAFGNIEMPTFQLKNADIAIVVYFRPWPLAWLRLRRLFRFTFNRAQDGTASWDKQPSSELEKRFDLWFDRHRTP